MTKKEAKKLLNKYRKGLCTEEERHAINKWMEEEVLLGKWDISQADKELFGQRLKQRIDSERAKTSDTKIIPTTKWWYAAAIVLLIGLAGYFLLLPGGPPKSLVGQYDDALPGGNRATLTLANGRAISLDSAYSEIIVANGDIKYKDGTSVGRDVSNSSFNTDLTLTTPKGGTYQVILADGTLVRLNAASTLKYPAKFTNDQRMVFLEGEAFFEVTKSPSTPFVVTTRNQQITVLGTDFNVTAYNDDHTVKTTLKSGAVRVFPTLHTEKTVAYQAKELVPGEQTVLFKDGSFIKQKADIDAETGWVNGYFSFENKPFDQLMKELARWYDIDIIYEGEIPDVLFYGGIQRSNKLSAVVKVLESAQVKCKITGRTLVIQDYQ